MTARIPRMSPALGWSVLGIAVVLAFALIGAVLSAATPGPFGTGALLIFHDRARARRLG